MRIIGKDMRLEYKNNPWDHVIVDNFLSERALSTVLAELSKYKDKFRVAESHPAKIRLAQIETLPIYHIFTSKAFKDLLFRTTHREFKIYENSGIQFRFSDKDSPAFPRHNDFIKERTLVVLFYLSNWQESNGGNLTLLHSRKNDLKRTIVPQKNRLVLFYSDRKNTHEVQKVKKGDRYSIVFELVPEKNEDRGYDEKHKNHAILS